MGHSKAPILEEQDEELLKHIHSLGLQTVEEYRQWCAHHGFSRKLHKDWRQRCRERSIAQHAVIQQRLLSKKREQRNPAHLFAEICEGRLELAQVTQPHLKLLHQALDAQRVPGDPPVACRPTLHLLHQLHALKASFFDAGPVVAEFGRRVGNSYMEALVNIAAYHRTWLRPVEDWKPTSHNARRQFASLLRHLFVRYDDMPPFFDTVWFEGHYCEAARHRKWFIRV